MESEILDDNFIGKGDTSFQVVEDWVRLVNHIIDFFLVFILYISFVLICIVFFDTGNGLLTNIFWDQIFPIALWFNLKFIYYFIFELTCRKTLGKFFTKTIVVVEGPSKISFTQIFFRSLIRLVPFDGLFIIIKGVPLHDYLTKTSLRNDL